MHRFKTLILLVGFGLILASGCEKLNLRVDTAGRMPLGDPDARRTVIVFSDFQCGFCKRVASELSRLQVSHPNRFKVYFKHYPLSYHPFAHAAACAAEAAGRQGKFWDMHDQLFAHTHDLSDENLNRIAAALQLDVEQFNRDRASKEVKAIVEADVADGDRAGLKGTPYILIDGKPFFGMHDELKRALLKQ